MKLLLLALVLLSFGWSADIDTKLYDSDDKEAYYREIEQQITVDERNALRPKPILQEERLQLARLRSAASQTVKIDAVDLQPLSETKITPEQLYKAVEAAATVQFKREQSDLLMQNIQSKLTYLKQRIERITKEDKPHLLAYQLQFGYYKLQQKNIGTKEELFKSREKEVTKALFKALPALECGELAAIDKEIAKKEKMIDRLTQTRIALEIDREKALIEQSSNAEELLRRISDSQTRYQEALDGKIGFMMQQSLCLIREGRNKEFFKRLDAIETLVAQTPKEKQALYALQIALLNALAKESFGTSKIFFTAAWQESLNAISGLKESLTAPLFVFNEQPISFVSIIKAIILVILGFVLGVFYKRWIARLAKRWPDMSQMSIRLASNIGYYLIIVIAVINAVGSIGIDMSSISLIAGALSIGIGFGLQTVVSNFIAGVILMFERTIRIGDTIEISDLLRGRVTDMRIRSTTIKTFDNIDIVVPNSSFIQNNVINWTLEDRTRRLHIPFGVAYGTEVEKVKHVVLDELAQSELTYINDDPEKQPEVWMVSMSSSSVDFELLVWVEWNSKLRPNSLRSDFLILIYNALYKHGIQIPFPQLDLYVKQLPEQTNP